MKTWINEAKNGIYIPRSLANVAMYRLVECKIVAPYSYSRWSNSKLSIRPPTRSLFSYTKISAWSAKTSRRKYALAQPPTPAPTMAVLLWWCAYHYIIIIILWLDASLSHQFILLLIISYLYFIIVRFLCCQSFFN